MQSLIQSTAPRPCIHETVQNWRRPRSDRERQCVGSGLIRVVARFLEAELEWRAPIPVPPLTTRRPRRPRHHPHRLQHMLPKKRRRLNLLSGRSGRHGRVELSVLPDLEMMKGCCWDWPDLRPRIHGMLSFLCGRGKSLAALRLNLKRHRMEVEPKLRHPRRQ